MELQLTYLQIAKLLITYESVFCNINGLLSSARSPYLHRLAHHRAVHSTVVNETKPVGDMM